MTNPQPLCGITRDHRGTAHPPCTRPAGHVEAYCDSGDGRLFLAHPDEPAAGTDAVALLADNQHLRQQLAQARAAAGESFRAEFGNVIVKGQDGDWANIADYITTGARIPACGSFYPHHTDTRCVLHKGHRGSHRAPWGTRDMAWPYDPRETQPAEETHVVADDSDDPEHIDDCPGCDAAARPAATTQDGGL